MRRIVVVLLSLLVVLGIALVVHSSAPIRRFDENTNNKVDWFELDLAVNEYFTGRTNTTKEEVLDLLLYYLGDVPLTTPVPVPPPPGGPPETSPLECDRWVHGTFYGGKALRDGGASYGADITFHNPDSYYYPDWAYGFGRRDRNDHIFTGVNSDGEWVHTLNRVELASGILPNFNVGYSARNRLTWGPDGFYVNGERAFRQNQGDVPYSLLHYDYLRSTHLAQDGTAREWSVHQRYENLCAYGPAPELSSADLLSGRRGR